MEDGQPRLIALSFAEPRVPIVPAPRRRVWMDAARDRWPNRCLPLLVANEAGWALLNTQRFRATWDGGESPAAVKIEFEGPEPSPGPASSHFGHGIITFRVPYVFRTPPGWNLLARGPANWPKEGICPLEGLVETDWAYANFTMNWKLTRTDYPVEFEEGEPFCVVLPQRRGELETFRPEVRDIASDPSAKAEFDVFTDNRQQMQVRKFLAEYSREFDEYKEAWERHYYRGLTPSGEPAPEHQTKLHLAPFADSDR
jgi:hypothetical protein